MNTTSCLAIVKSSGQRCKAKARDINGFCHRHISQSAEYAKTHPYTVLKYTDNVGNETFVKVPGSPGLYPNKDCVAFTSNDFGN